MTKYLISTGTSAESTVGIPYNEARACFCRGRQNGQPLCPCMMRDVQVRNGRYVWVQDLGPTQPKDTEGKA